jgi:hypothetical protein
MRDLPTAGRSLAHGRRARRASSPNQGIPWHRIVGGKREAVKVVSLLADGEPVVVAGATGEINKEPATAATGASDVRVAVVARAQ